MKQGYIKSPLNYIGGKHKLLNKIIPEFPRSINRFVDLFAGGLNVGINVEAEIIYANDYLHFLIDMYEYFKRETKENILGEIDRKIVVYELSNTNEAGYKKLREDYNKNKNILDLFVLTCYSFNHQIRFNNSHGFNTPFGKNRSSYNESIKSNLIRFLEALHRKNIIFSRNDFIDFDFSILEKEDLVYCDPPYLITTGSYNDGKRGFKNWTEKEEKQLLLILDTLHSKGIHFALSNVLLHKGEENKLLLNWSKKYKINHIDNNYSNCNYQLKNRNAKTVEVLITNY